MDFYKISLTGLVVLCGALLVRQPTRRQELERRGRARKQVSWDDGHPELQWYKAYGLAMAADWVQGPYLFSLYRDEYSLTPGQVSSLFITDFLSTALSAYLVGALSDKYGRKLFCMIYCLLYTLSCLFTIVPITPLLLLGRVLGGISTTILFTTFESWMVTNFREQKLAEDGCDLSRTFATNSVVNGLAAILAGVMGQMLVEATGSKKAPFILAVFLLWSSLQTIWARWSENYGTEAPSKSEYPIERKSALAIFRQPAILALVFASTMFEGSMYLLVLYWVPTMTSVQKTIGDLPYGLIFSSFMAATMASALSCNIILDKGRIKHAEILVGILLVADLCFVALATPRSEGMVFWLFCLFEACVGMYWPCMGYLKGQLVDDAVRTRVYSIMRTPLNIFVVVSLLMARDSDNTHGVFSACSVMLTASFAAMWVARQRNLV
ncbi:DUF791-domain-containing protein [Xylariaceae sp. FL1019]|nr:DUF791-domain-containing protein [Xylariaceae sp. FL1019]